MVVDFDNGSIWVYRNADKIVLDVERDVRKGANPKFNNGLLCSNLTLAEARALRAELTRAIDNATLT